MRKILLSLLIPIFLILIFSMSIGFSNNYYLYEFNKIKPEQQLNLNPKFIRYSAQVLSYYLSRKIDTLEIPGFKNFFNEKELEHMKDVKNIFLFIIYLTIINAILIFMILKKQDLPNIFLYSFIPIIVFLIFYLLIPFDKLFTYFHLVLFKNDLWLLNPESDRLIVLLPEEFFIRASQKILFFSSISLIFLYLISVILEVKFEKKDK